MRLHRLIAIGMATAASLVCAACHNKSDPILQQGYEALDRKQFDTALASADQYLQEQPNGRGAAEAAYLRGRAIEQRNKSSDEQAQADLREAQAMYRKALSLGPARGWEGYILTSLADTYYWMEDYSNAERHWRLAHDRLDDTPRNIDLKSWVLYRIGLCQQRMGQFDPADQTFEAVYARYPQSEAAKRALEHHGSRAYYIQVGAFAQAASADRLTRELQSKGFKVARITRRDKANLVFICVGPMSDYAQAAAMRAKVVAAGYKDCLIVP